MKIFVTDKDGKEHSIEATNDWSVMEVVRDAGLEMLAQCGGSCACATWSNSADHGCSRNAGRGAAAAGVLPFFAQSRSRSCHAQTALRTQERVAAVGEVIGDDAGGGEPFGGPHAAGILGEFTTEVAAADG